MAELNRITSNPLGVQPTPGDPMAAQRKAGQVQAAIGSLGQKLEILGQKVEQDNLRGADHFAKVEAARRNRELNAALEEIGTSSDLPESGAGYNDLAVARLEQIQDGSRKRAGNDPNKLKAVEKDFELEVQSYGKAFEEYQRNQNSEYLKLELAKNVDDASQRVSRDVHTGPRSQVPTDTLSLIRSFEGFRETPYWDVNAYRTGFGSDTITKKDGSFVKVTKGTRVSREDAERDLARRAANFEDKVRKGVGDEAFERLSNHQRAVLTSIAYNYGTLPLKVRKAVQQGGDVAAAIRKLKKDNKGVNAGRREKEANIYETGHEGGVDAFGVPVHTGPLNDWRKSPFVQDELAALHEQIYSMNVSTLEKREAMRLATNQIATGVLQSMVQTNPSAALASIRAGHFDDALEFNQTSQVQGALIGDAQRTMENEITAVAKQRDAEETASALDVSDDYVSGQLNGDPGEELPRAPTPQELARLTHPKQQAVASASHEGSAIRLMKSATSIAEAEAILANLKPQAGEGGRFAHKQAAYEAAKKIAEKIKFDTRVQRELSYAVESGRPVNTSIPGVSDAIDALWQDAVDAAGESGTSPLELVKEFVDNYGVLPEGITETFALSISSDDPNEIALAASIISSVNRDDPEALAGVNQSLRDVAFGIQSRMAGGDSATEAKRLAFDAERNRGERKDILKRFAGDEDDIKELVEDVIDESWIGAPNVTSSGLADLVQTFEDAIVRTQDKEAAKMASRADWRANYSQSTLMSGDGADVWSKRSPERTYGVWGDAKKDAAWISEQLREEVGGDWDSLFLIPSQSVYGEEQVYEVMGIKDGARVNLSVDFGAWSPDPTAEIQVRDVQTEATQKIERARDLDVAIKEGERFLRFARGELTVGPRMEMILTPPDDKATKIAEDALSKLRKEREAIDTKSERNKIRKEIEQPIPGQPGVVWRGWPGAN